MNPQEPYQPFQGQQGQVPPQQPQPQPVAQPMQPFQAPTSAYQSAPRVSQNFVHVEPPKTWRTIGIVGIATTVLATGGFLWALINYFDQKDNVDTKVSSAVALAIKEQAEQHEEDIKKIETELTKIFTGPEDYGSVSFNYPKNWSVYISKDAQKGGNFEAYMTPGDIAPISNSQQYALRVTITDTDYDRTIASYESLVKKGDLNSRGIKVNGDYSATRLDGAFSKDIRGSAVIFKIRDKTVTLRTDAETFKSYFDDILKTITFNS